MTTIRRYRLFFPGGVARPAKLSAKLPEVVTVPAKLPPRFARVLLILHEARRADIAAGLPPGERGWLTRDDIVQKISELTGAPIENDSLTRYVSNMVRDLESEFETQISDKVRLSLVEREFMVGMRLAEDVELEVIGAS